ncbi:hypothetical protein BSKO_08852 [Bryopsis sp. KO-2023]|nr:hypothetical protein BSKO_08852 [Bryopsis sp. KO-2023]
MKAGGLTVGRFFGHGNAPNKLQLQTSPGSYDNSALSALDKVLDMASQRGLKMVVTLSDNWNDADGKIAYARWAGKTPHDFFVDSGIKQWFKDHITFITNRVNSVNGKVYKDDDAIFAWNLMNEPRCDCDINAMDHHCEPGCADAIQSWIEEMSDYLKASDPNHLITVGEEGFYSFGSGREHVNPDTFWGTRTGQDFVRNHRPAAIDYCGIHVWPDNWEVPDVGFQQRWVYEHLSDSASLGKPMVVEEFGKSAEDTDESRRGVRDPHFRSLYDIFASQRQTGGPMKGLAFWEFGSGERSDMSIFSHESTWQEIIVPESQKLNAELEAKAPVDGCVPGTSRSYDALYVGSVTYIAGGDNLVASDEGIDLVGKMLGSSTECADACAGIPDCNAFTHNPNEGACFLKSGASFGFRWDGAGWKTYWRQVEAVNSGSP